MLVLLNVFVSTKSAPASKYSWWSDDCDDGSDDDNDDDDG